MPSNVIIFDAEYIAELTSNMNKACSLMGEAVSSLKRASLHEGWQCKECVTISDNLLDLNSRLGRLDEGVNETTRILGGSISRFAELEAKYKTQAESLSEELRGNYGFTASGYSGSSEHSAAEWAAPATGGVIGGTVSRPNGTSTHYINNTSPDTPNTPQNPSPSAPSAPNNPSQPTPNTQRNTSPSMPSNQTERTGSQPGNSDMNNTRTPYTSSPYTHNQSNIPSWNIPSGGNVQLPVTHIPYKPEAAVTGLKAAAELENIAVTGVTASIITVLGSTNIASLTPAQQTEVARSITQAYNTGRQVVNNTTVIINEPAKPHTQENIAVATGLTKLFGGISKTLSMLGLPGFEGLEGLEALLNGELLTGIPADVPSGGGTPSGGGIPGVGTPSGTGETAGENIISEISGKSAAESVMGDQSPTGHTSNHRTTATQGSGTQEQSGQKSDGQSDSLGRGMHFNSAGLATNAESVINNIGNDADSQEVKDLLQTFTSKGAGGKSESTGDKFLNKIKSSIMGKMQGDMSLGFFGSIGIQDFLSKVL